jgi:PAS domain S-box-containing protein
MSGAEDSKLADLQKDCRLLQEQVSIQARELNLLRARFARYETALRGSHVIVYTQDRNLRYTSISNPMLGHSIEGILGRTDEEILPPDDAADVVALKRAVLATGEAKNLELALAEGPDARWHDLHIEPLRDDAGAIIGLACASLDVTERKEGEAHLRLLLRELTHRSKNLLAVIQAMARQTARHAGSIDGFLNLFSSRLQALAASHDLLIRESWTGASLRELIRSQLVGYLDRGDGQIVLEGPEVGLKPEAAQNLGLALHELTINAAKYGALSVPGGHLSVSWVKSAIDDDAIALDWREYSGPKVKPRRKRGFGSLVIERNLSRALDRDVKLVFDPDGLHCHIVIPSSHIVAAH